MRKLILLAAAVAMVSTTAFAAMPVGSFALGWVNMDAPIGIRYQIAEKIAGDVGVGFAKYDGGNTEINVHVGVPFELVAHDRCSLDFRPGFTLMHTSFDDDNIDSTNDMMINLWLAVNVMLTDNFGVNAAHGVDIQIVDGGDNDNLTNFFSNGANVTNIGWFFWF